MADDMEQRRKVIEEGAGKLIIDWYYGYTNWPCPNPLTPREDEDNDNS